MTSIDDKRSKGTLWVSLFIDRNTAVHFDSFRIEYIPQEVLIKIKKKKKKKITHNRFRIPEDESVTCGFYCIALIEYVLAGKGLLGYINLFSADDYKKNGKIVIYKFC